MGVAITNLSIQRRRLNELEEFRHKFFEVAFIEPDFSWMPTSFTITMEHLDTRHMMWLEEMGFSITQISAKNDMLLVRVTKAALEKVIA